MSTTIMTPDSSLISTLPEAGVWSSLAQAIRDYDADVVILVARKMPRLVEALRLEFGKRALCISDQAIPFVHQELKGARIAVVDDIWNVGTTMLRARDRVQGATPRSIRLFALGAKDAVSARRAGVHLAISGSLAGERLQSFINSVPRALRLVAKPFDVDFPIVPCLLRAPFSTWDECWHWLQSRFGDDVHSTVDEAQLQAGFARATINLVHDAGWTVKVRLYFDFTSGVCNVATLALAPSLPLANDYPAESLSSTIYNALAKELEDAAPTLINETTAVDTDGLARVNTFCDSLLFYDIALRALAGLVQREHLSLFSLDDVAMQFGDAAARNCAKRFEVAHRPLSEAQLPDYLAARASPTENFSLVHNDLIVGRAKELLSDGFVSLALDALFGDLAQAVGADNPTEYKLDAPYTKNEIARNPYLRLRLGFTYEEIITLFRVHLRDKWMGQSIELLVSALMDSFIDHGGVVPTFTLHDGICTRIYRKGEANPRWDEDIARLRYALSKMSEEDRKELLGIGRTRVAKITAIMAMSGGIETSLSIGPLERGNIGVLADSVVERRGGDITKVMRQLGFWQ